MTGIATDAAGNLYIVDRTNEVVEKVTPDGTLSVIAGTLGSGGSPVPGPATSSGFNFPQAVAVDGAGNVYISDQDNYVVEKITPGGTLSVIAGNGSQGTPTPGPATSSALGGNAFGGTQGLAVDAAGNVYIADAGANVVEKVTPDGILSIVAGNANGSSGVPTQGPATSSALNQPFGVAFDAAGNLYIADRQNHVIEKVTPDGVLSIVAGNGTGGSPTPGPATSSRLGTVYGLAVDAAGDVYLGDYSNSRIELITAGGTLSVVAGNGTAGAPTYGGAATSSALHSPIGVAVTTDGTFYIDDEANLTIDRVGLATPGAPGTPAATAGDGSAQLSFTAPMDQGTSPITSYQASLDAGQTWQPIATTTSTGITLNATLTGLSDGTTYAVLVRAVNTAGPGADSLASQVTPVAPPVTTTTPTTPATTTPATTTPTTPTTPMTGAPSTGAGDGVSLSEQAAEVGVGASGTGALRLPLVCPQTAAGCDADGNLALALSSASSHALIADAPAPVKSSVIARFAGVQIEAGHSRLVSVKLTPAATRYLQVRGIRRVRVTLTIHNHLSGGPAVTTTQRLWLNIAALRASCPAAAGTLTGASIGQMRLGLTPAQAHRLGRYRRAGYGFERYCLTAGAIRVRYPAQQLLHSLSATQRDQQAGRVYLALTANPHYTINGVHARTTVAAAKQRLALGTGVKVGKNTWYLVRTTKAVWVLKAQNGIIHEIGITSRSLTSTPHARRLLVHNL